MDIHIGRSGIMLKFSLPKIIEMICWHNKGWGVATLLKKMNS